MVGGTAVGRSRCAALRPPAAESMFLIYEVPIVVIGISAMGRFLDELHARGGSGRYFPLLIAAFAIGSAIGAVFENALAWRLILGALAILYAYVAWGLFARRSRR
jgi:hypothetical protein